MSLCVPLLVVLVFTSLVFTSNADNSVATLVYINIDIYPNARCLDGSLAGYYIRNATSLANQYNWVISLQGGGECVTEADCLPRMNTSLGSSKYWLPTMPLSRIQDTDPANNPDMYDWNMLFIPYCSADVWVGQQSTINDWGVYFNGHNIISSVLQDLAPVLQMADTVVFSGESAGGIGAMANMDFVASLLPQSARVLGAPIAGFYFFAGDPYTGPGNIPYIAWDAAAWEQYYTLYQAFVPEACAAAYPSQPWLCALADVSFAYTKTPLFITEAQTDCIVMLLHDGVPALSSLPPPPAIAQYATLWAANMSVAIEQVKQSITTGLFHAACWLHTGFDPTGPLIQGASWIQTFGSWAFGHKGATKLWDNCPNGGILCNPTCPPPCGG